MMPTHTLSGASCAGNETARRAAEMVHSLSACLSWLIAHGVSIQSFTGHREGGEDKAVIRVAASPRVYSLFPERAWRRRIYDGNHPVFTWVGFRQGVRVEWEDAQ
jgi:hypothetical protein